MKLVLVLVFVALSFFGTSPVSHATKGIDEVTSLRSKLHATVEHMALDEKEVEAPTVQAHWLLVNDVPWKWDESALVFSGSFVNTNYKKLVPENGKNSVINFDF